MSTEYNWFKKGREHRRTADPEGKLLTLVKPTPNTEIGYEYHDNGIVRQEKYYKNGGLHRDGDKPSIEGYHEDGTINLRQFHKYGKLHRDGDKPAMVWYDVSGTRYSEKYYKDGLYHRDGDKPAWVEYDNDGNVSLARYFKDGVDYTHNITSGTN